MDIPESIKNVVIHCGSNNICKSSPIDFAKGIMCVAAVLLMKYPFLDIIITGLLLRDKFNSFYRNHIILINGYLADYCSNLNCKYKIRYLKPATNWTFENGMLNTNLFWKDNLHLSKAGDIKFAKSIINEMKHVTHQNIDPSTSSHCHKYHDFPPLPSHHVTQTTNQTSIKINSYANILCSPIPPRHVFHKVSVPSSSSKASAKA